MQWIKQKRLCKKKNHMLALKVSKALICGMMMGWVWLNASILESPDPLFLCVDENPCSFK